MEKGSLLREALQHQQHHWNDNDDYTFPFQEDNNCLWLDIFCLQTFDQVENHLFYLAKLSTECNSYFQQQDFLWHYGCDGPVFGVTITNSIPHLRAYVRYGVSVQDEWMAVHYILKWTKEKTDIVVRAWDAQDGQIIMIQLADLLPPWVDEDSASDRHEYACWLWSGNLQLFRQPHLTLSESIHKLRRMQQQSSSGNSISSSSSHPKLQKALLYWLHLNHSQSQKRQRTPMVLPRTVAHLFQTRPELLPTAIQMFCRYLEARNEPQPFPPYTQSKTHPPLFDFIDHHDWVWTIQTLSRTNYAMARTMVATTPTTTHGYAAAAAADWSNPDTVPLSLNAQVKRMQRKCGEESSKHLKPAVSMGIRVMVGLQLLLQQQFQPKIEHHHCLSSLPGRIVYWDRIETQCRKHQETNSIGSRSSSKRNQRDAHQQQRQQQQHVLLQFYQQGPNQSKLDLTYVLQCPVYPEERNNWTLITAPETSLPEQIQHQLKQSNQAESSSPSSDPNVIPRRHQVDDEEWMNLMMTTTTSAVQSHESSERSTTTTIPIHNAQDLDELLSKFQTFLHQSSSVEGVVTHHHVADTKNNNNDDDDDDGVNDDDDEADQPIVIRPRIFLNIMHATLTGKPLVFPTTTKKNSKNHPHDPYFHQEDYDWMDDATDSEQDDDYDDEIGVGGKNVSEEPALVDIMSAMDDELERTTESRPRSHGQLPTVNLEESTDDGVDVDFNEDAGLGTGNLPRRLAEDVEVLHNLMRSLHAGGGGSGPVTTIIQEMDSPSW